MSHGVPYFDWREGRPRWCPGPSARAKGIAARDLKDGKGNYLPLEEALDLARELCVKHGILPDMAIRRVRVRRKSPFGASIVGYIYFLWTGDRVKIGFSKNPFNRTANLKTGLSDEVELIVASRGTMREERELHEVLKRWRLEGEWFTASNEVVQCMMRVAQGHRPARGKQSSNVP